MIFNLHFLFISSRLAVSLVLFILLVVNVACSPSVSEKPVTSEVINVEHDETDVLDDNLENINSENILLTLQSNAIDKEALEPNSLEILPLKIDLGDRETVSPQGLPYEKEVLPVESNVRKKTVKTGFPKNRTIKIEIEQEIFIEEEPKLLEEYKLLEEEPNSKISELKFDRIIRKSGNLDHQLVGSTPKKIKLICGPDDNFYLQVGIFDLRYGNVKKIREYINRQGFNHSAHDVVLKGNREGIAVVAGGFRNKKTMLHFNKKIKHDLKIYDAFDLCERRRKQGLDY